MRPPGQKPKIPKKRRYPKIEISKIPQILNWKNQDTQKMVLPRYPKIETQKGKIPKMNNPRYPNFQEGKIPQNIFATMFPNRRAFKMVDGLLPVDIVSHPPSADHKHALPYIKLARFSGQRSKKGCFRHDAGVVSVSGAECDYDLGEVPMSVAVERLQEAGIHALLHTSASNAPGSYRWRVLLPFSEEYQSDTDDMRAYRKRAVETAQEVIGVSFARESYILSQGFLFGSIKGVAYEWAVISGRPINTMAA